MIESAGSALPAQIKLESDDSQLFKTDPFVAVDRAAFLRGRCHRRRGGSHWLGRIGTAWILGLSLGLHDHATNRLVGTTQLIQVPMIAGILATPCW
jgi:hypothetical protein